MFNTTAAAISVDLVKAYKLRTQSLSTVYWFLFFDIPVSSVVTNPFLKIAVVFIWG